MLYQISISYHILYRELRALFSNSLIKKIKDILMKLYIHYRILNHRIEFSFRMKFTVFEDIYVYNRA